MMSMEMQQENASHGECMMINMKKAVKCLRCGYDWTPRVPGRPKQCPACHQSRWDKRAWEGMVGRRVERKVVAK